MNRYKIEYLNWNEHILLEKIVNVNSVEEAEKIAIETAKDVEGCKLLSVVEDK